MDNSAMTNPATLKELQEELNPELPIYILIDPMLGEPLASVTDEIIDSGAAMAASRVAMWGREIIQIELSAKIKLPPTHFPYLVVLEGLDDPLLQTTLELAHEERNESQEEGLEGEGAAAHRIGAWLQSNMQADDLAKHLASMLDLTSEVFTKATYLRLVDRRTFALVRHLVGDASISKKMDQLQNWVYLDVQGNISALKSGGEAANFIVIKNAQWARLQQGEILNRAMALWLGEAKKLKQNNVSEQPALALYEPLFNALDNATQATSVWPHRFERALDSSIWAALKLLYPTFEKKPTVAQLLQDVGTEEEPPEPMQTLHTQISALMSAA